MFDATAALSDKGAIYITRRDGDIISCDEECSFITLPKTTRIEFADIPGVVLEFDKQCVTPREMFDALNEMRNQVMARFASELGKD